MYTVLTVRPNPPCPNPRVPLACWISFGSKSVIVIAAYEQSRVTSSGCCFARASRCAPRTLHRNRGAHEAELLVERDRGRIARGA